MRKQMTSYFEQLLSFYTAFSCMSTMHNPCLFYPKSKKHCLFFFSDNAACHLRFIVPVILHPSRSQMRCLFLFLCFPLSLPHSFWKEPA